METQSLILGLKQLITSTLTVEKKNCLLRIRFENGVKTSYDEKCQSAIINGLLNCIKRKDVENMPGNLNVSKEQGGGVKT